MEAAYFIRRIIVLAKYWDTKGYQLKPKAGQHCAAGPGYSRICPHPWAMHVTDPMLEVSGGRRHCVKCLARPWERITIQAIRALGQGHAIFHTNYIHAQKQLLLGYWALVEFGC